MKNIILEDTTLRDGEQSPGIAFSKEEKLKILDLLIDAGVKWIEAGIPIMGGIELATMKEMLERKNEAILVAWNRGVKEDISHSMDIGFQAIHIGLPTSSIHLKESIKKDRKWLLNQSSDLIKYSKDRGVFVSISAEDIGRTEISFLQEYACHVKEAGADRLRLSDTIGILTPKEYGLRISKIREVCDIDLQCHAHNDFGLATANTLEGLSSGARYFHVTVNGIGERAGMADIAHVVFALKHLYNIDLTINGEKLRRLSEYVADITGYIPPPWYPIVGRNVFSHESGIHVNGMLRNSSTFEPFSPKELGRESEIVLGKHSGRATIEHYLKQAGHVPTDEELKNCLSWLRDEAIRAKGSVPSEKLVSYYSQSFLV